MKFLKITLVLAIMSLFSSFVSAKEMPQRLGVGVKNNTSESLPSLAGIYHINGLTAVTGGVGVDTKKDYSKFQINAGIRHVIFHENQLHYYAELLAAKPESLVKSEDAALGSLKAAGPVQLRLTMLRDLPAKKISDSFVDALKANDVAVDEGDMKTVLGHISSMNEFKQGEIFSIVGNSTADKGFLYLQKPNGEIITIAGSAKLPEQMFSIWFGKPVDDKLADLKKELLK